MEPGPPTPLGAPPHPQFLHVRVWVQPDLDQAVTGDRAGPGPRLLLTHQHACSGPKTWGVNAVGVSWHLEQPGAHPLHCLWQKSQLPPSLLPALRAAPARGLWAVVPKALWLVKDTPSMGGQSCPLSHLGADLFHPEAAWPGARFFNGSLALPSPTACPELGPTAPTPRPGKRQELLLLQCGAGCACPWDSALCLLWGPVCLCQEGALPVEGKLPTGGLEPEGN